MLWGHTERTQGQTPTGRTQHLQGDVKDILTATNCSIYSELIVRIIVGYCTGWALESPPLLTVYTNS